MSSITADQSPVDVFPLSNKVPSLKDQAKLKEFMKASPLLENLGTEVIYPQGVERVPQGLTPETEVEVISRSPPGESTGLGESLLSIHILVSHSDCRIIQSGSNVLYTF